MIRTGNPVLPPNRSAYAQGSASVLINYYTPNKTSPIFEVTNKPVLLSLYKATADTQYVVYAVLRVDGAEIEQALYIEERAVVLDAANTSYKLQLSGRYRVRAIGLVNDDVLAYVTQKATSNDVPQPSGAQANRPNLFFDGGGQATVSKVIEVTTTAWQFSAFGLTSDTFINVWQVYGTGQQEREEPYIFEGYTQYLAQNRTALLLQNTGRYRFKLLGPAAGVILVGNPSITHEQATASAPPGSGVTSVGLVSSTGLLITGSPITSSGVFTINLPKGLAEIGALTPTPGDVLEYSDAEQWQATKYPDDIYLDGGNF